MAASKHVLVNLVVCCHWELAGWLHIFPRGLMGDIYANFLEQELPALLDDIRLQTNRQYTNLMGHCQIR
jgi:hypothetical protein